jgi:hypothetical protein
MARLRYQSRVRLTAEEFGSLKELADRPLHSAIPNNHRDRLIRVGYAREVLSRTPSISTLALTGEGLRRLALGK